MSRKMKKHHLSPFWEKVEHFNSKLIVPALILLLFVIIFELFIPVDNHILEQTVTIADWIIVTIFVIDLIFLAIKAKSTKFFFENYWLDIIAVFPFGIIFAFVGSIYRAVVLSERIVITQAIFHETLEATKGVKVVTEGSSKAGKITRIVARSLRFITKSKLFEKFSHPKKRERKTKKKRR